MEDQPLRIAIVSHSHYIQTVADVVNNQYSKEHIFKTKARYTLAENNTPIKDSTKISNTGILNMTISRTSLIKYIQEENHFIEDANPILMYQWMPTQEEQSKLKDYDRCPDEQKKMIRDTQDKN